MFDLIKILNGRINVPEPETLPVTASESYNEGEALVLTEGKLTKAGATQVPTHISAATRAGGPEGYLLPCYRVTPEMIFEAPMKVTSEVPDVGALVTLDTTGLGVTDTAESGVATLYDTCGAAEDGDHVLVIFA